MSNETTDITDKAESGPALADDRPIVLVPGFMASNLWRKQRGLLSLPLLVWPLSLYTLTAQLIRLRDGRPLQAKGLVYNYYQGLCAFITAPRDKGGLGRVPGENFWIFAYDWRQSSAVSGQELANFIREKLAR